MSPSKTQTRSGKTWQYICDYLLSEYIVKRCFLYLHWSRCVIYHANQPNLHFFAPKDFLNLVFTPSKCTNLWLETDWSPHQTLWCESGLKTTSESIQTGSFKAFADFRASVYDYSTAHLSASVHEINLAACLIWWWNNLFPFTWLHVVIGSWKYSTSNYKPHP